jgi:hypothetical protein
MPSARVASSRSQFDPVCLARPIASSAHRTASAVSPLPTARSARQRSYIGHRSSVLSEDSAHSSRRRAAASQPPARSSSSQAPREQEPHAVALQPTRRK